MSTVAAVLLAGCADQEASYVGARSVDPSYQSGLGDFHRDRPIVMPPPGNSADHGPARYQWNGNPNRIIEGNGAPASAKPPALKPQPAPGASLRTMQTPNDARMIAVQPGDTLYGIAERYGVTVASLTQANALDGAPLRPGQRLVLPPTAR